MREEVRLDKVKDKVKDKVGDVEDKVVQPVQVGCGGERSASNSSQRA